MRPKRNKNIPVSLPAYLELRREKKLVEKHQIPLTKLKKAVSLIFTNGIKMKHASDASDTYLLIAYKSFHVFFI